jgi:diguanylate cyclase (GGDEF)-like protein
MQRRLHESKETLEEMAKTDDLTKLENKRAFNVRLNDMWDEVHSQNGDISLLMIDIDYFKLYNDNYGHVQGDIILKRVAGIISETVSYKSENVTRWGGEEFVVLLPYINGDNAKYVAERIIKAIRLENIPHAFSKLPKKNLTVSVGVASMHPCEDNTPIELLMLSDKSLYEAKGKGRNCVGGIYVG